MILEGGLSGDPQLEMMLASPGSEAPSGILSSPSVDPPCAWPWDGSLIEKGRPSVDFGDHLDQRPGLSIPMPSPGSESEGSDEGGESASPSPFGTGAAILKDAVAAANAAVAAVAGHTPGGPCQRSARGQSGILPIEASFCLDYKPSLADCCLSCGAPQQDLERFCAEVASELHGIVESVDLKMELWKVKLAERDQVIKKLSWRLKHSGKWSAASGNSGPQVAARRASLSPTRAAVGDFIGAGLPCRFTQAGPEERAVARPRRATGDPTSNAVPAAAAVAGSAQSAAAPSLAQAAARKSQRPREAADKVQLVYLRQEIAQLRRMLSSRGRSALVSRKSRI